MWGGLRCPHSGTSSACSDEQGWQAGPSAKPGFRGPTQGPPQTPKFHIGAAALALFTHNSHLDSSLVGNSSEPAWKGRSCVTAFSQQPAEKGTRFTDKGKRTQSRRMQLHSEPSYGCVS